MGDLKSELCIRPIRHQREHRADAHILIAFLAYCLQVTLKQRLLLHAPGLTPTAVLEKLAEIDGRSTMVDSATLHATFYRHQDTHREVEIAVAEPAATAPGGTETGLRNRGANRKIGGCFVMKTFP